MKNKVLIIIYLFITSIISAQQIGDGYAPVIADFTLPLTSGIYGGVNNIGRAPDDSHPWQHLFVLRHGNPANNYQLQISSSFLTNDRLFFRKISGELEPGNPAWIELATRGNNSFTGSQFINGALTSSVSNDTGGYINLENPTKALME